MTGGASVDSVQTEGTGAALIWSPCPSEDAAVRIARLLLDEQLIACANIVPSMMSVFAWQGETQTEQESGLLLKTTDAALDRATARLEQIHPYDAPAIAGWKVDMAGDATLDWLERTVPHVAGRPS